MRKKNLWKKTASVIIATAMVMTSVPVYAGTSEEKEDGVVIVQESTDEAEDEAVLVGDNSEDPIVAQIGEQQYETLVAAVSEAEPGNTIKLLADVVNTGKISLPAGVTLDGNDKKITGNSSVDVNPDGGTVINVNFEDIHNEGSTLSPIYASDITGTLSVTGCTFTNWDWDAIQTTPQEGAVINIIGNTFTAHEGENVKRAVHVQSEKNTDFTITVTSNKFYGCQYFSETGLEVYYPTDKEKIQLSGNFMDTPMEVCIGTGYSYNNAYQLANPFKDKTLTNNIYAVAMMLDIKGNNKLFTNLQDAFNAELSSNYIYLIGDVVLTNDINIRKPSSNESGSINLRCGDYSITQENDVHIIIPNGVSVVTDKKNDVLFTAENGYEVYRTENQGEYTYTAKNEAVAECGGVRYPSLAEAIDSVSENSSATVTLLKDATDEKLIYINNKKNITLDLNGKNIGFGKDAYLFVRNGTLNVTGFGKLYEQFPYYSPILVKGNKENTSDYSVVNVGKDVELEGWAGLFIDNLKDNDLYYGYGIKVNIDGKIKSVKDINDDAGHGVYVNGNIKHIEEGANIPEITLGPTSSIESEGNGIYAAGHAKWTMQGDVTAPYALSIKSGIFNISSGIYHSTGEFANRAEANGNGSEDTGAALSITSNDGYAKKTEVNVTGGTFISDNGYAVYEGIAWDSTKNDNAGGPAAAKSYATLSISGGTFKGNSGKDAVSIEKMQNKKVISGGIFSSAPSDYVVDDKMVYNSVGKNSYCVSDFEVTARTGSASLPYGGNTTITAVVAPEGFVAPVGCTYQWYKDGKEIPSEKNVTLSTGALYSSATYTVKATVSGKTATSNSVAITVASAPVYIPPQPTTPPATTDTVTNPDGSTTSTTTQENTDGSTTTTVVDKDSNGNVTGTTETTEKTTGNTTTKTETATTVDGAQTVTETTTVKNQDGSTEETKKVTDKDANGNVTGTTETVEKTEGNTTTTKETTTAADGSQTVTESTLVKNEDGSSEEKATIKAADGSVTNVTTTTQTDGSATEVKETSEKNDAGNTVDVTATTKTDSNGDVTSVKEQSVITNVADNTSATVNVLKDGEDNVKYSRATVNKTVDEDTTRVKLEGPVVDQIESASGTSNVTITMNVNTDDGDTKYSLKVATKNLQAGNKLYVYKENPETGERTMVNSLLYTVTEDGSVTFNTKQNANFVLVNKTTAAALNKAIKKTLTAAKPSSSVKAGKKIKMALNPNLNMENVKSVKYSTTQSSVAKVSSNGTITAKKAGIVSIKAMITLKNGYIKTVTTKITVKE